MCPIPETKTKKTESTPVVLFCKPKCLSNESYSLCILLFSAMLYSIMAMFIKLITPLGIPSTELVFLRAVFQGILVVLAILWFRDTNDDTRLIYKPFGNADVRNVVIARGFVGGFGFLLYYYTISVLPLGDATTLLSLNPILTVFAASIFLGEKVQRNHLVSALLSAVGCVLIAQPSFVFNRIIGDGSTHEVFLTSGYISALSGACCGAAVYILIRRAGKGGVHTLQLLFAWVTFGIFFSLLAGVILPILSGHKSNFVWPSTYESWGYILGVCCFGSMGHLLMNYAARHAPAGLASIMRSSGIFWSYSLELFIFHKVPEVMTIWGAVLIVISLAVIAIAKTNKSPTNQDTLGSGMNEPKRSISCTEYYDERPLLANVIDTTQDAPSSMSPLKDKYGSMNV